MKDILVIGDSCRDIFVYCNSDRLCPDVPVPVLNVVDQTENPGMARNVQRNIRSLGIHCNVITNPDWHDITKTRYVHKKSNHTFFRVDSCRSKERIDLDSIDYSSDIIVISDYNKGFLSEQDIETICKSHPNVFLDTKKILGSWASDARYIKINAVEYQNSINMITPSLFERIICTTGEKGCLHRGKTYNVDPVKVQDVSGAGDTFMAGLVVGYLSSEDIDIAIRNANRCASEVVRYRGVTVVGELQ
jgi:bifunctional ADP-heptose synthase (sugar kinase/adenylyltransferase)